MPSSVSPASVPSGGTAAKRHRPSTITVFASAFVAGAAAAFGINRALDSQLAQSRPQVECDPIFVALHSLPQGSAVTVWDVALRDWPRAMLPSTALGPHDTFDGMVLRHPLREGQPLLSVQLVPSAAANAATPPQNESFLPPTPAADARTTQVSQPDRDLWAADGPEGDAVPKPYKTAALPAVATPTPSPVREPIPVAAEPAVPPAAPLAPAETPRTAAVEPDTGTRPEQPAPATGPTPVTTTVVPESPTASLPSAITAPISVPGESPLPETAAVAERTRAAAATDTDTVTAAPVDAVTQTPAPTADTSFEPRRIGEPTPADQPSSGSVTESAPASATDLAASERAAIVTPEPTRGVTPLPLVAPVPMSPSTDIERPLAAITVPRSPRPEAKSAVEQESAPAEPAADRVSERNQEPTPAQNAIAAREPALEPELRPEPLPTEPTEAEPAAIDAETAGIPGNEIPATDSVLVPPPAASEPAAAPAAGGAREPTMRYLVVPERIAMQADSSFVTPPQARADDQAPPQAPAAGQPAGRPTAHTPGQANYFQGSRPSQDPQAAQAPTVQPLPATAAEARARPAARPEARPQKPSNQNRSRTSKTLGSWLPSFMGGTESRGPAATARTGQAPSAR